MERNWTLEALSNNVLKIVFNKVRAGWSQDVLLSSDRHHDSLFSNHALELVHLEKARGRDAPIIDTGDLFDAMQGKYDPRKSYDELREELKGTNYLDRVVQYNADFYSPYGDLFALVGRGNHETSQLDRHGTDLTANLVREIRARNPGSRTEVGGYGGWVWFQFLIRGTVRQSYWLKYYHGSGSSTRGVGDIGKMSPFIPDADLVHTGHSHNAYVYPMKRERVSQTGRVDTDVQWWIKTPGYKMDFQDGTRGWSVEMGHPPTPLGVCWLRFELARDQVNVLPILDLE